MTIALTDLYGDLRPEDVPPAGLDGGRHAIAKLESVKPGNVAITSGGVPGMTAAVTVARIRCGGSVALYPQPHFPGYPGLLALCGLRAMPYPLPAASVDATWLLHMVAMIEFLDPAAIVLNSPHNPTGLTLDDSAIAELVGVAHARGGVVLLDEAFAGITLDSGPERDLGTRPGLIRVGTFNKRFPSMADHRVGYVIGEESWINDIAMAHRTLSLGASISSQRAVVDLLDGDVDSQMRQFRMEIREHRDIALSLLSRSPHLSPANPSAGFFMIVRLDDGVDCAQFARTIREETGLWCASAPSFGVTTESWIRLRLAVSRSDLVRHCELLVDAADRHIGRATVKEVLL